ncbi:hypothetical protein DPMN_035905 [Dreissena polymorpha]|uniref:Uncharacterized protein n=1 Tax=Dreissena polymorpha TaxID=45954 RepID=A0A9D4RND9_DREPO|nr:hypothetical protein DPMN_035905 [Dreissena polymorpha]
MPLYWQMPEWKYQQDKSHISEWRYCNRIPLHRRHMGPTHGRTSTHTQPDTRLQRETVTSGN